MPEKLSNTTLALYSLLIAYKDRDIKSVERCLKSIQNQRFQHYELVFLDYGSRSENSRQVKALCHADSRFRYFYSDTRGYYWNRSSALNLASGLSTGDRLVFVDVDLILPENFLEFIDRRFQTQKVLMYQVFYLPQNFNAYADLFKNDGKIKKELAVSNTYANGLIVLSKELLKAVGGYDEYYRIWGWEDIDLMRRLEAFLGKKREVLSSAELATFHQWHPKTNEDLPAGWAKVCQEYLNILNEEIPRRVYRKKHTPAHQQIMVERERPALQLYLSGDTKKEENKFTFNYPKSASFSDFYSRFIRLKSGEYLWVNYRFEPFQTTSSSRLAGWATYLNRWLKRMGLSYRLVDLLSYDTEVIALPEIRDFVFYFVLHFEQEYILDYYLEIQENQLTFVVVKM